MKMRCTNSSEIVVKAQPKKREKMTRKIIKPTIVQLEWLKSRASSFPLCIRIFVCDATEILERLTQNVGYATFFIYSFMKCISQIKFKWRWNSANEIFAQSSQFFVSRVHSFDASRHSKCLYLRYFCFIAHCLRLLHQNNWNALVGMDGQKVRRGWEERNMAFNKYKRWMNSNSRSIKVILSFRNALTLRFQWCLHFEYIFDNSE